MKSGKWLPLIGIGICVFIFNMSEFMPIGLLSDMAVDFGTSESRMGLIISIYAWAVAILSLPLMLLLRKMEYRRMLLMCVILFAAFQFMSGLSGSYWILVISRLGVAVAHGIFWSIASPLAVKVVPDGMQKLALSTVSAGTSIAMIIGLPLGRMIGLALGWRMTFIVIAVVSIAALMLLVAVFPRVENPGTFTLRRVPDIFRNKALVCMYVTLAIYVTGYYTGYSYIEPFMAQIAGMSENMITVMLTAFGLAGIFGSMLFTKVYDRMRFRFLISMMIGAGICLFVLRLASASALATGIVCTAWGLCAISFCVASQNETIKAAPQDAIPIAMSLYSGIFNVGIAMGSIVGGAVTDSGSVGNIGIVGGAFVMASAAIAGTVLIKVIKKRESERPEPSIL